MFRSAFWLVLPTPPMFLIDLAVFHDDDQVLPGSSNSLMLAIGSPVNQQQVIASQAPLGPAVSVKGGQT